MNTNDNGGLYTDVPIDYGGSGSGAKRGAGPTGGYSFVPASRTVNALRQGRVPKDTPDDIKKLYMFCRKSTSGLRRRQDFYEAALLAEGITDRAGIAACRILMPSYASLDVAQLRSYFTLRADWRRGVYPELTESSGEAYVRLYIYETLCGVHVRSGRECIDILDEMDMAYGAEMPLLGSAIRRWKQDYVIYHSLTFLVPEVFKDAIERDRAQVILMRETFGEEMFDDLCSISTYDLKGSPFYKANPEFTKNVIMLAVNELDLGSMAEVRTANEPVTLFYGALFYDPGQRERYKEESETFRIDDVRCYKRRYSMWTLESPAPRRTDGKNNSVGIFMREADVTLREVTGFKRKLSDKYPNIRIKELIREKAAEQQRIDYIKEHPPVTVDMTKLSDIRQDADVIRDCLLTEEEIAAEVSPKEISAAEEALQEERAPGKAPDRMPPESEGDDIRQAEEAGPFDADEAEYLRCIISGRDGKALLREAGIPEGVMISGINEKAMDIIGDIVLDISGEEVYIIEDYIEDIKEIIG